MSKLLREILDMSQCPKNPVVTFYDRDDIKIGSTSNDVEFEYIRLQIAKNKIDGCYLIYNGEKYQIESNGQLKYWPKGLFDAVNNLIGDILQYGFKGPVEGSTIINERDCPNNDWVDIYDNENKIIARTNSDLVWHWVRLQIKLKHLDGCYVIFRGERYEINSDGRLPNYPHGLFDENTRILAGIAFDPESVEKYTPKSKLININKCPYNETVDIYDNENNLIVHTSSDLQYDWVRSRIKELKLKDCYLVFRGQKIKINEYGCPLDYPDGMFDNHTKALLDLL